MMVFEVENKVLSKKNTKSPYKTFERKVPYFLKNILKANKLKYFTVSQIEIQCNI